MRWRRSESACSMALAIWSWPGRYSKGSLDCARMPPGEKNSCSVGSARFWVVVGGIGGCFHHTKTAAFLQIFRIADSGRKGGRGYAFALTDLQILVANRGEG